MLLLTEQGSNINCNDETGATPLIASIRIGHKSLIEPLIKLGCDLGKKDKLGNQALHWASLTNNYYAVLMILDSYERMTRTLPTTENVTMAHLSLNTPNLKGETPIQLATREGNSEIVELYLQYPQLKLSGSEARNLLEISRLKNHAHVSSVIEKYLNGNLKKKEELHSSNTTFSMSEISTPLTNSWSPSDWNSPTSVSKTSDSPEDGHSFPSVIRNMINEKRKKKKKKKIK